VTAVIALRESAGIAVRPLLHVGDGEECTVSDK
jgi:hypothetical protein